MAKRLIIADLKSNNNHGICTGHYYALASNYKEVFSDICEVKIASGPIYLKKFKIDDMLMLPCDYVVGYSKLRNTLRMIRNGWSLFSQVTPDDVVVVQQSQPAMILFTLLLTCFRKQGFYMIQYSGEPADRLYYRIMLSLKKRYIKGVICPNDTVGKAFGLPYISVPDYIYCSKNTLKQIPFAEKKYDFCSIGRIEKDKGVSACANTLVGKGIVYLIAGVPQDANEEIVIKTKAAEDSNIIADLSYLTEEKYKEYIANSRYCLLNYCGSYANRSSGVVLDTIFSGIPVVGSRCKALQFVEDLNLGVLFDDVNTFDFAQLLDETKYNRFISSIDNFKKSFVLHKQNLCKFLNL